MNAVLDTSVIVAREHGRLIARPPQEAAISVMTLVELHVGVLTAKTREERALRLKTLADVERTVGALPMDREVALVLADIIAALRGRGRRINLADAIIAATARRHGLPVYTQDDDFAAFPGVEVVRI